MRIEVLLFGRLAELLGNAHLLIEDATDTDMIRNRLEEQFPALKQVKYQVAVDQLIIHGNKHLADGMTVALMPPFSGG
ncbi:MoaD/ThiS family protein [Pedobacter sp. NJ-S-72]